MGIRSRLLAALGALALASACSTPSGGGPIGVPTTPPPTSAAPATPTSSAAATASATATPPPTQSTQPTSTPTSTPSTAPASPSPVVTATPTPTPEPPAPRLVLAYATQTTLTLAFDAPMQAALPCGASGPLAGGFESLDSADVRSHYHSTDPVLDEALASISRATILADCKGVHLQLALLAAPGTYSVVVSNLGGLNGTLIEPSTAQVTIADGGKPTVLRAEASGSVITVTFSEPMLEIGEGSGVIMAGNYRLDGAALAPATPIACVDRGCRGVRITLATALTAGSAHTLRVANVVDRVGLNITPDPTPVSFTAR